MADVRDASGARERLEPGRVVRDELRRQPDRVDDDRLVHASRVDRASGALRQSSADGGLLFLEQERRRADGDAVAVTQPCALGRFAVDDGGGAERKVFELKSTRN